MKLFKKSISVMLVLMLVFSNLVYADKVKKSEKDASISNSENSDFKLTNWSQDQSTDTLNLVFSGNKLQESSYSLSVGDKEMDVEIQGKSVDSFGKKEKYEKGDVIFQDGKYYECVKTHVVKKNDKWNNGNNKSYWQEIVVSTPGEPEEQVLYKLILKDGNGVVVTEIFVPMNDEFKMEELKINLADYIDTSMGYDVKIVADENSGERIVIISSAPSIGLLAIGIYSVAGVFFLKTRRKRLL